MNGHAKKIGGVVGGIALIGSIFAGANSYEGWKARRQAAQDKHDAEVAFQTAVEIKHRAWVNDIDARICALEGKKYWQGTCVDGDD